MRTARLSSGFPIIAFTAAAVVLSACTGNIGALGGSEDSPEEPALQPGESASGSAGLRFPRLSGAQWKHSVLQLLRLPPSTPVSLPTETLPHFAFDTNQQVYGVSSPALSALRDTVEQLVTLAVADDAALTSFIPPGAPTEPQARAEAVVRELLFRAFRRPPSQEETSKYTAYVLGAGGGSDNEKLRNGLRVAIQIAVQSPFFLDRVELGNEAQVLACEVGGRVRLTGYELATRLSLALFDVAPDDAMLADAKAGKFDDESSYDAQIELALADPRARATMLRFHEQMYSIAEFAKLSKDGAKLPLFQSGMGADMQEDALRTVGDVIDAGGGVRELLLTRTGYVNARLAKLYGIAADGLSDSQYVRRELPPERTGIFTRAGWLAWSAGPVERKPILRGVVLLNHVLCEKTAGAPPIPAEPTYPTNVVTNRQRVEFATSSAGCQSCHATINNKGFAFQRFDASGAFVAQDNGQMADATGSFVLDGKSISFDGAQSMFEQVAVSRQAQSCYAKKWTEFLLGYPGSTLEEKIANQVATLAEQRSVPVRDVIRAALRSDAFTTRKVTEAKP